MVFRTADSGHQPRTPRRRPLNLGNMAPFTITGSTQTKIYNIFFIQFFPCMLETWEAGVKFMHSVEGKEAKAMEIARLLGWTRFRGQTDTQLNNTASACHAAHALIFPPKLPG